MATSLMVMGTASDVGKSVIVTGLCRLCARAGLRVAPFKSQNMSNNAAVCRGAGEIGRAQAVQAEACGLEASVDMNPVLLKPESETGCQVVIGGRPRFRMSTHDDNHYYERAWPAIVESYQRLSAQFDAIIIEGAGGAAEVNLRDRDVANWRVAELANAPVLIVADIDKGGALAALVGTVHLLSPMERARVKGLIINKFRGDTALLKDGLRIIEENTGAPILGVVPYANGLDIPLEDSASLVSGTKSADSGLIQVGVVLLPRISNHTDFEALAREPDVELRYIERPAQIGHLDLLCLPGSKSTIADLLWLRECGWDRAIAAHYKSGGSILGICGGYQMLGRRIADPRHLESSIAEAEGLGMLAIKTVFDEKITALVRAREYLSNLEVSGYEIHCGRVSRLEEKAAFQIRERDGLSVDESEGVLSGDGRVLGTAIHGLLDEPGFRRRYLDRIRARKGLKPLDVSGVGDARGMRMRAYDRFADMLAKNLDIAALAKMTGFNLPNA
ncbi:MAG: cobyric acid synthase [Candidatus Binataceae bacterium]